MAEAEVFFDRDDEWLNKLSEADVLISAADEDSFYVEKYMLPYFKKANIKYIYKKEHFTPGHVELGSISQAVKICKKTMVVLSRDSIHEFPLELYLAIHKSITTKKMQLTAVLIKNITNKDIPKMPWLQHADTVLMDENMAQQCLEQIVNYIKHDRNLCDAIPVCNVGVGMAWSHFTGYLEFILPDLQNHLTACEIYRRSSSRMPVKLYILLPKSAQSPGPQGLESLDERFKYEGQFTVKGTVAGTHRIYNPNIHSIRDGNEIYYCCVEIPNAFCSLGSIFEGTLAKMTPQQRHVEVERFYYQMMDILNQRDKADLGDKVTILPYNAKVIFGRAKRRKRRNKTRKKYRKEPKDEAKTEERLPGTHLLRAIKEDLKITQSDNLAAGTWRGMPCDRLYSLDESADYEKAVKMKKRREEIVDDVCILYYEGNGNGNDDKQQSDRSIARSIRTFLDSRKIKRCSLVSVNKGSFHETEMAIRQARWTVLLISNNSLSHMTLWIAELLTTGNMDDVQRLLPVLCKIHPDQIPDFVRWVTYVSSEETSYIEKIGHIVAGESVSFKSQAPIGNVSEGFVWSFVVGYLRHILPELAEKGRKKYSQVVNDAKRSKFCPVLFELIPWKTCCCPNRLSGDNDKIKDMGRIEPVIKDVGSVKGREFGCNMFQYTTPECDYYFMAEFATPIRTLYQMHRSMTAGLSNEHMENQAIAFGERLEKVLTSSNICEHWKGKCEVIMYDDTTKSFLELLVERIDNHTSELHDDVGKVCQMFAT